MDEMLFSTKKKLPLASTNVVNSRAVVRASQPDIVFIFNRICQVAVG